MNLEIGPTLMESFDGFGSGDVESVIVNAVDLRQCFNEVDGVAFVSGKLRSNRMSVDCDPQPVSPVSLSASLCLGGESFTTETQRHKRIYLPFAAAACESSFCWPRVSRSRMRAALPRSPRR